MIKCLKSSKIFFNGFFKSLILYNQIRHFFNDFIN